MRSLLAVSVVAAGVQIALLSSAAAVTYSYQIVNYLDTPITSVDFFLKGQKDPTELEVQGGTVMPGKLAHVIGADFYHDQITKIRFDNEGTLVGDPLISIKYELIGTANNETEYRVSSTVTPLPAALPLFAGGLGLMGFITRRRKQHRAAGLA